MVQARRSSSAPASRRVQSRPAGQSRAIQRAAIAGGVLLLLAIVGGLGAPRDDGPGNGPAELRPVAPRAASTSGPTSPAPRRPADPAGPSAIASGPKSVVEDILAVEAFQLTIDYDTNSIAADDRYKGRRLAVTGLVEKIRPAIGYLVMLYGDPAEIPVRCMFARDRKDDVAALEPGQKVIIVGTCTGKLAGVNLEDCSVDRARMNETVRAEKATVEDERTAIRQRIVAQVPSGWEPVDFLLAYSTDSTATAEDLRRVLQDDPSMLEDIIVRAVAARQEIARQEPLLAKARGEVEAAERGLEAVARDQAALDADKVSFDAKYKGKVAGLSGAAYHEYNRRHRELYFERPAAIRDREGQFKTARAQAQSVIRKGEAYFARFPNQRLWR